MAEGTGEDSHHRDGETSAPPRPGVALMVASGLWQSIPGRSHVTGLPPPHPCRGSRWPCCGEWVGRSNRGRGLGEETNQQSLVGVEGELLARRLFHK